MNDTQPSSLSLAGAGPALTMGRGQRTVWILTLVISVALAGVIVFGLARSTALLGQDSPLAQKYTADFPEASTSTLGASFNDAWGQTGGAKALVLYDTSGPDAVREDAETTAIVAGNLATHFGGVQALPMEDYRAGLMDEYDGVIYVGLSSSGATSEAFHADMLAGETRVLWAGDNVADVSSENTAAHRSFIAKYGWDPLESSEDNSDEINEIFYKGSKLTRDGSNSGAIIVPEIVDPSTVEVLAEAGRSDKKPWAIRSANLTYIGENPLSYVDETNRYLAFADLYYDLLGSTADPVKQAAVRLEDVDAGADPEELRAMADYLHEQNIPFQVAVIPIRISRTPGDERDSWLGLSLKDRPEVVAALHYMQGHGGTLVQHGTTHQYGTLNNPYNGSSGADFEFYRAECSRSPQPNLQIEPCQQDSYIVDTGPVGPDTVTGWTERLREGRDVFKDLDFEEPGIFETPHYLASSNAYVAMAEVFETRYERSHYFAGQLSGRKLSTTPADQFFPYRVNDIYGTDVLPENLGNITEVDQNNHAVRDPAFLISGARANLVVRESTASFFYHPFLGVDQLRQTVEGIQELGYTFVSASDLK